MLKLYLLDVTISYDARLDEVSRPYREGKRTEPKEEVCTLSYQRTVEMDEPDPVETMRRELSSVLKEVTRTRRSRFYGENPDTGREHETIDTTRCIRKISANVHLNINSMDHPYGGILGKCFRPSSPDEVFADIDGWVNGLDMPHMEGRPSAGALFAGSARTPGNSSTIVVPKVHQLWIVITYDAGSDERNRPYITGRTTEPRNVRVPLYYRVWSSPDETLRRDISDVLKKAANTPRCQFYKEEPAPGMEDETIDAVNCIETLKIDVFLDIHAYYRLPFREASGIRPIRKKIARLQHPSEVFSDIDRWVGALVLPDPS